MTANAVIFGCEGLSLTDWERDFFADSVPFGFILFARNCESPEQIRTLVADLRESVGRGDAPVLIDQEGGRVARLTPPQWRAAPAAGRFGYGYRGDWKVEKIELLVSQADNEGLPAIKIMEKVNTLRNQVKEMRAELFAVKPARLPSKNLQTSPAIIIAPSP